MAQFPSTSEILTQLTTLVTGVVNKDLNEISGFSERQLNRIANHTVLIGEAATAGVLTEEDRTNFLTGLQEMVENFVLALEGLALALLQKVWDAVTNFLWGLVESAISIKLPRPMLPS